jgi:hypothetical protein
MMRGDEWAPPASLVTPTNCTVLETEEGTVIEKLICVGEMGVKLIAVPLKSSWPNLSRFEPARDTVTLRPAGRVAGVVLLKVGRTENAVPDSVTDKLCGALWIESEPVFCPGLTGENATEIAHCWPGASMPEHEFAVATNSFGTLVWMAAEDTPPVFRMLSSIDEELEPDSVLPKEMALTLGTK